jgi:hypothetical protein
MAPYHKLQRVTTAIANQYLCGFQPETPSSSLLPLSRGYNLTILAAGKGTRMHADTGVLMHKILAEVQPGMSLLGHKLTQFAGKVNSFVIVTGYRDHEILGEIANIMKDLNGGESEDRVKMLTLNQRSRLLLGKVRMTECCWVPLRVE